MNGSSHTNLNQHTPQVIKWSHLSHKNIVYATEYMHLFNWTMYLSTKPAPASSLFVELMLTLSIGLTGTLCFFIFLLLGLLLLLLFFLQYTVAITEPTRNSRRTVQAGTSIARSIVLRFPVWCEGAVVWCEGAVIWCEGAVIWCEGAVHGCKVYGKGQWKDALIDYFIISRGIVSSI